MSDTNMNVWDRFFDAVEEYHTLIKKPRTVELLKSATYEIKRGMFYTCLRRYFDICKRQSRNYSSDIKVKNLICVFNDDNSLKQVFIDKDPNFNMIFTDRAVDTAYYLQDLKKIVNSHTTIYPTKALNELASIINQL